MSILSDQRRLVPVGLLYLVFVSAVIYLAFSHWGYDDPYITYRYAHNLLAGRGFVYNPGEHVLSTTTPLFTLLLALGGMFWADLPHLGILVGAASLALGGLFLWDLARSWKTPAVGWAGLLIYPFFPLLLSTLGSETPLYLTFCLGSFAFYTRQRYTGSALCAVLAVLTRPDGILLVVVLAADFILQKRRPEPWRAIVVFLACLLPWLIFAWLYFGSPLPATLAAKQHQAAMAISQGFASGFWSLVKEYARHWFYWIEAALALLGLAYAGSGGKRWLLLLAWSALYFASYSFLGVSRYFWYYAPLVPAL
ncbi:MAG TPA: hypothetical protein VF831_08915, partial [Anaerolineales bacterium]